METIGIDPGPKYVGVVIRDGDTLILSSTYVRPEDMTPVEWARTALQTVTEEVINHYPNAVIGIENVTVPNSHHQGKVAMMNPKHVIHLALVVGAFAGAYPDATMIRPGKNGSQPKENYPKELSGRRPKTLAGINQGAGTRDHEKSAWDVAGEVAINARKIKK